MCGQLAGSLIWSFSKRQQREERPDRKKASINQWFALPFSGEFTLHTRGGTLRLHGDTNKGISRGKDDLTVPFGRIQWGVWRGQCPSASTLSGNDYQLVLKQKVSYVKVYELWCVRRWAFSRSVNTGTLFDEPSPSVTMSLSALWDCHHQKPSVYFSFLYHFG